MTRALLFLLSAACLPTFAGSVQLLPPLPNAASSNAIQLDAAGNIYVAGSVAPQNPQSSQDTSDAFVAKVSADGSKLIYFTILSGSFTEAASALVVNSDGSAYVTGATSSPDFAVTKGALQTTFDTSGPSQGFLVKVNADGTVAYSSYINGTTLTQITGIAVDSGGDVFLTGMGGPGYSVASGQTAQGFILKLDAGLTKVLASIYGYGGGVIALDNQGNIYVAGNGQPSYTAQLLGLPTFPAGAFQTTHAVSPCAASTGPGGPFEMFCLSQYIAKLDAAGKLLWATYVTGTYGAFPAGMAVDSAGNVTVAGTTNSSDYPVTAGAFQTSYTPAAPPLPGAGLVFIAPPNSTGYVTKVNATGTGLVWSTYFGGSFQDQITGMAVGPSGEIILSGRAASNDIFLADTPDGCRPTANQVLGFVARLSPDGASAGATQLVEGAPDCLYTGCEGPRTFSPGWPLALRPGGTVVVGGSNGTLASVDFNSSNRLACVTDPADNAQLRSVAPGELVTLFGADLAPAAANIPMGGVAQSSSTFGVFFNGIAAPVLYSSAQQINVQVPFEIAGTSSVQMQVVSSQITNPVSENHTLGVVDRQPAIFLSPAAFESLLPAWTPCGTSQSFGQAALALNADGSLNSCTNPASAGSVVTVFLNGFGVVTPSLATGAISQSPAVALTPSISIDPGPFTGTTVVDITTAPGSITGVARVQLQVGGAGGQNVLLENPALAGIYLRDRLILVWTR
jgi:uncharacterized protein (TIGR03437 family)